jgi:hypothetical protein
VAQASTNAYATAYGVKRLFPLGTAAIFPNYRRHTFRRYPDSRQASSHHVAQAGTLADVVDGVGARDTQAALARGVAVNAGQLYCGHQQISGNSRLSTTQFPSTTVHATAS